MKEVDEEEEKNNGIDIRRRRKSEQKGFSSPHNLDILAPGSNRRKVPDCPKLSIFVYQQGGVGSIV